jgi:hypothetical protein
MDGADEANGNQFFYPIAWSVVAIANEHAAKGLGGYFPPKSIFLSEVCGAAEFYEPRDVGWDTVDKCVGHAS